MLRRQEPRRVLIVENEEDMLEVIQESLDRLEGVIVIAERDPLQAAERLRTEWFDLVVTNLNMPGMNGLNLLKLAKSLDPNRPVVVLTGYPMAETAARCREAGAADYIRKPFDPADLISRVTVHLSLTFTGKPPQGPS